MYEKKLCKNLLPVRSSSIVGEDLRKAQEHEKNARKSDTTFHHNFSFAHRNILITCKSFVIGLPYDFMHTMNKLKNLQCHFFLLLRSDIALDCRQIKYLCFTSSKFTFNEFINQSESVYKEYDISELRTPTKFLTILGLKLFCLRNHIKLSKDRV